MRRMHTSVSLLGISLKYQHLKPNAWHQSSYVPKIIIFHLTMRLDEQNGGISTNFVHFIKTCLGTKQGIGKTKEYCPWQMVTWKHGIFSDEIPRKFNTANRI